MIGGNDQLKLKIEYVIIAPTKLFKYRLQKLK